MVAEKYCMVAVAKCFGTKIGIIFVVEHDGGKFHDSSSVIIQDPAG